MVEWNTATEWDNAVDETGVTHESVANTDNNDGTIAKQGYSYQTPPLTNGLVGWWPLHDDSAQDYSGNGNDGTVNGARTGVVGRGGLRAVSFDGTDDFIDISSVENDWSGTSAISAWVKPSVTLDSNSSKNIFVEQGQGRFSIGYNTSGENGVSARIYDGSNEAQVTYSTSLTDSEWYHVVAVFDSSDVLHLYLNGIERGTKQAGSDWNKGTNTTIGKQAWTNGGYFNGSICDVRIYNDFIGSPEVQTLYEWGSIDVARPADNSDGGISYYPFNSQNANDQWGSNDGTVDGATYESTGGPRSDGAYHFDGTNDFVDCGQVVGSTFTASAWCKFDTLPSSEPDNRRIVANFTTSDSSGWGIFGHKDTDSIRFDLYDSNGNKITKSTQDNFISVGSWYHTVLTADGSTANFYVNGEIITSTSHGSSDGTNNLNIGRGPHSGGVEYFDGQIDDVRLYNRAFSPSEVHDLYQYGTFGRDMRDILVRA